MTSNASRDQSSRVIIVTKKLRLVIIKRYNHKAVHTITKYLEFLLAICECQIVRPYNSTNWADTKFG